MVITIYDDQLCYDSSASFKTLGLLLHHRLRGVSMYRLSGPRMADEHPNYTPIAVSKQVNCY